MTRGGLSYMDWRAMARWQRLDHLARCQMEIKQKSDVAKRGGWKAIIGLVVGRLIGVT